jgi:hypothetical protein
MFAQGALLGERTDDYNFGNHDAASHIGGDCVWVSLG